MKKKSSFLAKFIFISLVIFICLFGVYILNGVRVKSDTQELNSEFKLDSIILPSNPELKTSGQSTNSSLTFVDFAKGWTGSTNSYLGHTFKHPKEATIETRESESVVVFMGEIQSSSGRTQTELFDGYIFRISKMELEPGMTTEMFAQQQRQSAQTECVSDTGAISPLKTISVNSSLEVVQYSVQGCRTDYTDSFATIDGATYLFSQLYVGAPGDKAMYKEITDQILSTVRIL